MLMLLIRCEDDVEDDKVEGHDAEDDGDDDDDDDDDGDDDDGDGDGDDDDDGDGGGGGDGDGDGDDDDDADDDGSICFWIFGFMDNSQPRQSPAGRYPPGTEHVSGAVADV